MSDPAAMLSSVQSTLDELTARISTIAEDYGRTGDEQLATGLFEVERNLKTALRRLDTILRQV